MCRVGDVQTAGEIIKDLGGPTAVAEKIGVPLGTVSSWQTRKSIPPDYWFSLINLASSLGKSGLTFEAFAEDAAMRRKRGAATNHRRSTRQ